MSKKFILALDQGTTGSRAFIFDSQARVVVSAYKEFKQYYPKPGWVEHDADEIWDSMQSVIKTVLRKAKISKSDIVSIGITNQRETTVLWDRVTSKPLHKAIVWQCRRTTDICRKLKSKKSMFKKKTGLVLDPYFSGTKVKWLLDNVKGLCNKAKQGNVCFGTIDSWLIWKLTDGKSHVTDFTNASRTLMFNIKKLQWDDELLKCLNVPLNILPSVQKSGSNFGQTEVVAGLSAGIPITAVLGDQQAALYGQGCFNPGSVKNTYGTGCFIVLNTGKKCVASKGGLLTTIASDEKGNPVYALEGSIFIAGALMQWLRDELKLFKRAADSEAMIKGLKDTQGVYVVPAFTGLGCPYWDAEARGIISGLTRGTNVKHIVRAALESMAYQTKDVIELMKKETKQKITELCVDGGACENNFLMQFQADIINARINRPKVIDSTVLGVALLAGIQSKMWKNKKEITDLRKGNEIFKPKMSLKDRDELYSGWLAAVGRAKSGR
ncbi:MAG: glycerol kinase [Candidatus Omnitrophota bacterium]|jgi:glycerol kinase